MSDKYKMTVKVRRPDGPDVRILSDTADGIHPWNVKPYIRKVNVTNSAFLVPYGSSSGVVPYGHDWYYMKLAEEQELLNGE